MRGVVSYRSKCTNAGIITGPNDVLVYCLKTDFWEMRNTKAKSIDNQLARWNLLNLEERRKINLSFTVGTVVYFNAVLQLQDQDSASKIPYLATSVWTEASMEWLAQNRVSVPPETPSRSIKPCTWTQLRNVNINPHQKFPDFPGISMIDQMDTKPPEPREQRTYGPGPEVLKDLVRVKGYVTQRSEVGCGGRIIGPDGVSVYFDSDAVLDLIEFKWMPYNCLSTKRRKKQSSQLQRGSTVQFNAKLVPGTTFADDPFTHMASAVVCEKTLGKATELGIELPGLDESLLSQATLTKFWNVSRNPEIEFPKARYLLEKAKRKAEVQDPNSKAKRRRIGDNSTDAPTAVDKESTAVDPALQNELDDGISTSGCGAGAEHQGDVNDVEAKDQDTNVTQDSTHTDSMNSSTAGPEDELVEESLASDPAKSP